MSTSFELSQLAAVLLGDLSAQDMQRENALLKQENSRLKVGYDRSESAKTVRLLLIEPQSFWSPRQTSEPELEFGKIFGEAHFSDDDIFHFEDWTPENSGLVWPLAAEPRENPVKWSSLIAPIVRTNKRNLGKDLNCVKIEALGTLYDIHPNKWRSNFHDADGEHEAHIVLKMEVWEERNVFKWPSKATDVKHVFTLTCKLTSPLEIEAESYRGLFRTPRFTSIFKAVHSFYNEHPDAKLTFEYISHDIRNLKSVFGRLMLREDNHPNYNDKKSSEWVIVDGYNRFDPFGPDDIVEVP